MSHNGGWKSGTTFAAISKPIRSRIVVKLAYRPRAFFIRPVITALRVFSRRSCPAAVAALALLGALPCANAGGRILARANRAGVKIEATSAMSGGEAREKMKATGLTALEHELVNLPPAGYLVTASLEGWPAIQRVVAVRANQTTEVVFEFKSGTLRLQSDPPGAVVRLAGKILGTTPVTLADLPSGAHEFSLQYAEWPGKTFTATIPAKAEAVATLRIPHGKLTVETTPSDAELTLDGHVVGRTPLVVESLPEGARKLQIRAKGYETTEISLSLKDRAELKIHPILLRDQDVLDPDAIISALWREGPSRTYDIAPNFNDYSPFSARNGVVRNLDRSLLDGKLFGRVVRYTATVASYTPATGRIDFAKASGTKAKYQVSALLSPEARANPAFVAKLVRQAKIELQGKLVAVEEPIWPSRTIYFEISQAGPVR